MTFPENDVLYLRDMLRYAKLAVTLTEKLTLDEVRLDQRNVLALERAVEIIGEASKRVSKETQSQLPQLPWRDIPWRDMARTRDFLAHHYLTVDIDILYRIATDNLPSLIAYLQDVVGD